MSRKLLLAAMVLLLIQGCEQTPLVERLQTTGVLRVATIASPLSCYLGEEGPAGLEYELVDSFARALQLTPRFTIYPTRKALIKALKTGKEEMAAGFIIPVSNEERAYYVSTSVVQTSPSFAHFMGYKRFDPETMPQTPVTIPAKSYAEKLLNKKSVSLHRLNNKSEEAVLALINQGQYHYTLTNRAQLKAHANMLPRLVPGSILEQPLYVRWLFARFYDSSLRDRADAFLLEQEENGYLALLRSKYIENLPERNFVTRRDFWKHVKERLPMYSDLFKQAGADTGIDWRLLAAIGYQESHWNASAKSPTGVRGIMMLTQDTARQQKISNRLDPEQSILGGARHLLWMEERIPERIQGEDLLWFTLASYNIGYGHLEDARVLTERQGANPDKWEDVKQRLPLLSQKKYYSTVKHGKARGGEPVSYVENIRYYYRLLVHWDNVRNGLDCSSIPDQRRLALKN
ncbi:membrane-bound lytic murein transglycosylase MltF [Thiolapillus sp.]